MKRWVGLGVIGDNLINIGRARRFSQDPKSPVSLSRNQPDPGHASSDAGIRQ
jgi:hypothetical protein